MGCQIKKTETLSRRSVFLLAKNYAIRNNVSVVFYKCSDWNFCEEGEFDATKHEALYFIYPDGKTKRV